MPAVILPSNPSLPLALPAHGTEHSDPWAWSFEPSIILGLVLFVALYFFAIGPLRRRYHWGDQAPRASDALFILCSVVFLLALISPLDRLADEYLFSAHMTQHIIITTIVPPLWLLGTPPWLLRPLLRNRVVARLARALTYPPVAFALFVVVLWVWHWPALYEAALTDEGVHAFQHLIFVAAGVINWWPVLSPLPELPRLGHPVREFYLFANCQPGVALGALFVFSREVFYQTYVAAPRLFGLSPQADQELGGLIMWIPGNAIYLIFLSVVFLHWLSKDDPDPVRAGACTADLPRPPAP